MYLKQWYYNNIKCECFENITNNNSILANISKNEQNQRSKLQNTGEGQEGKL